jgi:cation diffusion facilitator CzcD-associated flavoprotein CzcO
MPDDWPDFPSRAQFLDYLRSYADHFNLLPHIRFGVVVDAVRPAPDGAGWCVASHAASGGPAAEERFDAVLVCTGFNSQPYIPAFPGAETFQGRLLHSAAYKGPEAFAGQRVLVIGASSSASDLAVDISRAQPGLLLSIRHPTWITPRNVAGRPMDLRNSRFANSLPPKWRERALERLIRGEYKRRGLTPEKYLPLPPFDPKRIRLTPGLELLEQLQAGAILARPAIERIERDTVLFVDGRRDPVDVIIAATGYHIHMPFMPPEVVEVNADTMWLYRHVFPPDRPGLAFIGFCTVGAAAPPAYEMQARWVAAVLAGRLSLPSGAEMQASLDQRRAECAAGLAQPMKLKMPAYTEKLARELGAYPQFWRHPTLFPKLFFGPMLAAHYRLDGPGKSAESLRMAQRL